MEQLEGVAIGDKLTSDSFGRQAVYTVVRLTPTQAVCEHGSRFNLKTGYLVGEESRGAWGYTRVRKMTEADRRKIRALIAEQRLERFSVTDSNLEACEAFLLAHNPPAAAESSPEGSQASE